jgi:hypothetical protein
MENAQQLAAWKDIYVMLGTSAAALIGMLFVASSLHLNEIVNNEIYRIRSRNITLLLIAIIVQAAATLMPQPTPVLGAEIVAVNLCGLWPPITFTYHAFLRNRKIGERAGFSIYRAISIHASYLLGIAGGAALVKQLNWGMYLVTIAFVSLLVSAIWNAWLILLGIGQAEKAKKEQPHARR